MKAYPLAILFITLATYSVDLLLWRLPYAAYLKKRNWAKIAFWLIPLLFSIINITFYFTSNHPEITETEYYTFTQLNGYLIAIYLGKSIALAAYHVSNQLIPNKQLKSTPPAKRMSRSEFLGTITTLAAIIPFSKIIHNINKGRFKHRLYPVDVKSKALPQGLDGMRIIQLSDLHLGNFNKRYDILNDIIDTINRLNADIIVITGDFVNNFATEIEGWESVFSKLKAKHGKYGVLGNHDYGDYSRWSSPNKKEENLKRIKRAIKNCGFELLNNANTTLTINNSTISIIGVENWGHPPFPRYGDLDKSLIGAQGEYKLLLTHDPDHWNAEVVEKENIHLSLAGHTHGMQVGFNYKEKQWSPAQWKYKHWGGLYKRGNQHLYVNRGLGVIGMPIRIGMPAEISLITLKKAD